MCDTECNIVQKSQNCVVLKCSILGYNLFLVFCEHVVGTHSDNLVEYSRLSTVICMLRILICTILRCCVAMVSYMVTI